MGRSIKIKGIEARPTSIRINLCCIGFGRHTLLIPPTPANLKYADRIRTQILQDYDHGRLNLTEYFPDTKLPNQTTTFKEWCEDWLDLIKPDVEATTHQEYCNALRGYFYPLWADALLVDLKKEIIAKGLAKLVGVRGKPISGKTFNNVVIPLRQALKKAYEFDKIKVALHEIIGTRSTQKSTPDPLELFEVEMVLKKLAERYGQQVSDYFEVAFWTGLRPSEMISIEWRHVDFNRQTIRVEQARVRKRLKATKTHTVRDVELPARAMAALVRQKAHTFLAGGVIFCNPSTGNAYVDTAFPVEKYWRPTLKALGIRGRDARQTRHTYATLSLIARANPGYVSRQMGHTNTKMLHEVYSKWIDGEDNSRERNKLDMYTEITQKRPTDHIAISPEFPQEKLYSIKSGT